LLAVTDQKIIESAGADAFARAIITEKKNRGVLGACRIAPAFVIGACRQTVLFLSVDGAG